MKQFLHVSGSSAIVALLSALLWAGGCSDSSSTSGSSAVSGTPKIATTHLDDGSVSSVMPAPMEETIDASAMAVQSLNFSVMRNVQNAIKAIVVGRDVDKSKVEITLEPNGDTLTNVNVDAGPDKTALADKITQLIHQRLRDPN